MIAGQLPHLLDHSLHWARKDAARSKVLRDNTFSLERHQRYFDCLAAEQDMQDVRWSHLRHLELVVVMAAHTLRTVVPTLLKGFRLAIPFGSAYHRHSLGCTP